MALLVSPVGGQFQKALPEVAGRRLEIAIPGHTIKVSLEIKSGCRTAHPDSGFVAIGGIVKDLGCFKGMCVEAQDPAVVRSDISA